MIDYNFFIDMHGVLVDSRKMLKNYEYILVDLFKKYNIPKEKAIEYHYKGLHLYTTLLNEIKAKNLTGKDFLEEMDVADKKWDKLLQGFTESKNSFDLESRNIEFLAGSYSDSFYGDGKAFFRELEKLTNDNSSINYFVVSNSNSKHLEGLFRGAGLGTIDTSKLLGWDKIESLKNTDYYYDKLCELSPANKSFIIGNSKEEMVLGKSHGFNTIFVEREFNGVNDFTESIDLSVKNLENLTELLKEKYLLEDR